MAEALHCGSAPEGLALPLHDVHERLSALADEERALPLPSPAEDPAVPDGAPPPLPETAGGMDNAARQVRLACEQARFAVYAWVDEQLLQSPRLDAAKWLSYSLQYRYCGTTSAGQEFFTRLTALARQAVPPSAGPLLPASVGEDAAAEDAPGALEAFVLHGGDGPSTAALSVYALCLLYGFRGMLRDSPETLHRYRKAAHALLLRAAPPPDPGLPWEWPTASLATALEKAAYILLPPVAVILFGALCAAALSGIPLPQF